jgi:hypothetical protein
MFQLWPNSPAPASAVSLLRGDVGEAVLAEPFPHRRLSFVPTARFVLAIFIAAARPMTRTPPTVSQSAQHVRSRRQGRCHAMRRNWLLDQASMVKPVGASCSRRGRCPSGPGTLPRWPMTSARAPLISAQPSKRFQAAVNEGLVDQGVPQSELRVWQNKIVNIFMLVYQADFESDPNQIRVPGCAT